MMSGWLGGGGNEGKWKMITNDGNDGTDSQTKRPILQYQTTTNNEPQ
jgi:hypothetical protein